MKRPKFALTLTFAVLGICLFAADNCLAHFVNESILEGKPRHDAFVNSATPSANYGSEPGLYVGDTVPGPGGLCRTFLKFTLPEFPEGASIINAQLSLYATETHPTGEKITIETYNTDTGWDEGTIDWTSQPPITSGVIDSVTSDFWPGWCHWDVTTSVSDAYGGGGGGGAYSVMLKAEGEPDNFWNIFYSKEQPPEPNYSPRLAIEYSGTVIPKGSDCYITESTSYVEFGGPSSMPQIPADFFGPGSDPFDGIICLMGEPFDHAASCADTLLDRSVGVYLPGPDPCQIDVELIELNLVSTEPIIVTYNGGVTESFFDVFVTLKNPTIGQMIITSQENTDGGTFEYQSLEMPLVFTFIDTSEGLEVILDTTAPPGPIVMPLSGAHEWQNIPLREAEYCGYDRFYPTDETPINAELTYNMGHCGQIDWSAPKLTDPQFALISLEDWQTGLADGRVRPMTQDEGEAYLEQFNNNIEDGPLYPDTEFLSPDGLYVWEDPNAPEPNDAGLVMTWGDPCATASEPGHLEDGNDYASAWIYVYPADPDLTNCTINITVFPPGSITQVSLALVDINGNQRGWYWDVGLAGSGDPLIENINNKVTIDLSQTGRTAASPIATTYSNNPAFDLTTVAQISFDENGVFLAATQVPPPGKTDPAPWNYWYNLLVTKNAPSMAVMSKYYVKYSQRPDVIDPNEPKLLLGWNEYSNYRFRPIVADDWFCKDNRPVTDIHWWGSFLWWTQPTPPPQMPQAFHIGIWTDVSIAEDPNFSHPGYLIWENYCDNYVWNFAGYDAFPDMNPSLPKESTFQFNQLLSEDEWFYQDPNAPWDFDGDPTTAVYWLSIAAIYDPTQPTPTYPWGWKSRRPEWNDDAVCIWSVEHPPVDYPPGIPPSNWPPTLGAGWVSGGPIEYPLGTSWDMCFELTTNEPDKGVADINGDGIVNFFDLALLAEYWLDQ